MSLAPMMMPATAVFAMAAPPEGGSALVQFIPFVLVIGIFYFVILVPMQRKQKKVQEFQQGLKVGDKVITTGGIYGLVTKVSDDSVQLQIANNVKIDIARAAIGGYQGQPAIVESTNQ